MKDIELILEKSPVGEPQSNGEVENAVRRVQIRTIRDGLETRLGNTLPGNHILIRWMVSHAAETISRYQIGKDGKTAHERLRGRKFNKIVPEFAEHVHYLTLGSLGRNIGESRWNTGAFLGIREESGEYKIGTEDGAVKCRTYKPMGSHEERWNWEEVNKIKGLPWQTNPGMPGYDIKPNAIMPDKGEKPGEGAQAKDKEAKYKGLYIYPSDLKEPDGFGYTDGCKGCEKIKEGANTKGGSRKHSEECRRRIIQALRKKKPEDKILKKLDENTIELANPEEHKKMKDKEKIR